LLPVANRPVMAYGLEALRRLGISEVCANACHLAPALLQAFGDGKALGLRLRWFVEEQPSGTAGGLKYMESGLDDDVLVVVPGDAMLDLDLAPLVEVHSDRRAFATLGTVTVADPSRYGVVLTSNDGRILQFQEKPKPGQEISREASTGIYVFDAQVLELIPPDRFCDFALDVFPILLARHLPFYAVPLSGYWTDIGTPDSYLRANLDYLDGRIRAQGCGEKVDGSLVGPGANIGGVRLHRSVIGARAALAPGTCLTDCVVWPEVTVREPVNLSTAVLTQSGAHCLNEGVTPER